MKSLSKIETLSNGDCDKFQLKMDYLWPVFDFECGNVWDALCNPLEHELVLIRTQAFRLEIRRGGPACKKMNSHSDVDKVDNEYVKIKLTKHRTMGFINVWRSKKGNEIRRRHLAFLQIKMFSSFRYKPLSMMGFKICFFGRFSAKTNSF